MMIWKDAVFNALDTQKLFEDDAHRSRFKELTDCYSGAAFFTKGLCKCMYLSSWDDEHFLLMLDMLNQLSLKANMNLADMHEHGELMAEEKVDYENHVMLLSCAFLMNEPFDETSLPDDMEPEGRHIIRRALEAAAIIDGVTKAECTPS